MVYIANLLNLLILILVWLIETYLFFAAIRLVLASSASGRQSHFYYNMKLLTDPLPNMVRRLLNKHTKMSPPNWLPWLTVILAACIARQLLVSTLLT